MIVDCGYENESERANGSVAKRALLSKRAPNLGDVEKRDSIQGRLPMISALSDFPHDIPNPALLSAALDGKSLSRRFEGRTGQVVLRLSGGFSFASRHVDQPFLELAVNELRKHGRINLSMTREQKNAFTWSWAKKHTAVPRYIYADPDWPRVEAWSEAVPSGYRFKLIDGELFGRCEWHTVMSQMLGSEERFLSEALGICLMREDEIVTEAYAITSEAGAEIGAITHPNHRGSKNGVSTSAYLMHTYLRDQPLINWSCDQENVGSWKTAERLGFTTKKEYQLITIPEESSSR
jgi:RimJ/RimL family protein N-acetyltransferase